MSRLPSRRLVVAAILLMAVTVPTTSSLGLGGSAPSIFEIGYDDFRLTEMGPDGSTSFGAYDPAMAYNSRNNEFLVVWSGSNNSPEGTEIWGQRIDAATGAEVGTRNFRISDLPGVASTPDVAYNSTDNEYLVVWHGDVVADEGEIWGQRLNAATGAEVGSDDFRISNMGPDGNGAFDAGVACVAYNSTDNEYLVAWHGDHVTDHEYEIYGQIVSAAGAEIGADFRLSDMGTDGNANLDATNCDVAYNSTNNNYLVVWEGDDDTGSLVDNEYEIYGQLVSAAGAEVGTDIRLSDMGTDGNYDANKAAVTYNSTDNEYLVVWEGFDDSPPAPLEATGGLEIWGQRVAGATGAEAGTNDFNISDMGLSGEWLRHGQDPDVAYNVTDNQYLVVWRGDDDAAGCADGEWEMIGQFLDGTTGADILLNDFRFTSMGPDDNTSWEALEMALAHSSADNSWLVVWRADNDLPTLVDNEWELYGQFLTASFMDSFIAGEIRFALPRSLLAPAGQ